MEALDISGLINSNLIDSNLDVVIFLSQRLSALNSINAMLKTTILRSGRLHLLQNSPTSSNKQLVPIILQSLLVCKSHSSTSPCGVLLFVGGVGGNLEPIYTCLQLTSSFPEGTLIS